MPEPAILTSITTPENSQESCTEYRQDNQASSSHIVKNTTNNKSFAEATLNEGYPTDEQCIIFPFIEGVRISDYVYKLAEVIQPSDIRFCSRISRNRVSFYLRSVKVLDEFLDKHFGIQINRQFIKARRLVNPDKRIVISNASPSIPHENIAETIKLFNVQLSSEITFIKFGIKEEEFSHLQSFRRQVYVTTDTAKNLPTSVVMNYLGQQRRIFFNDDKVRCYHCKEYGHISAACTQAAEFDDNFFDTDLMESNENDRVEKETDTNQCMQPSEHEIVQQSPKQNDKVFDDSMAQSIHSIINDVIHQPQSKRPPPSTISSVSSQEIPATCSNTPQNPIQQNTTTPQDKSSRNKNKKQKVSINDEQQVSTKVLLQPIEENFELHKKEYPVSFSNFTLIMDLVKGHSNPVSAISDITTDFCGISKILTENYKLLKHRSMKIRFTKLRERLRNSIPNKDEIESDLARSDDPSDQEPTK